MRGILLFSAVVFAAGSAAASVPAQPSQPERTSPPAVQLSGGVYLQERPLPGTTLHYPGMYTPLRGPHGGLLAERQQAAPQRG